MKKVLALVLALCMVLSLAACGGGSASSTPKSTGGEPVSSGNANTPNTPDTPDTPDEPTQEAVEPYTFNISYGGTPSSSMVAVMEKLQEIMTEVSGGAFTFNVYNDNSYKESQALDELMNDIVDITYLNSAGASTTVTDLAYLGLPGCYRTTDDEENFLRFEESVHEIMSTIWGNYGIHYLALRYPARMAIVGTGEVPTSPADLKGKIVRVSGTWMGKLAVSMDIATANVGLSELATALQRHTIDSCITGIEQTYSQMLGEVVDYACILPETDGVGSLVINGATWDKLSDAQKACVEEAVQLWMKACIEVSGEFYETAVGALEQNEVNVYYYSDEECDNFLATVDQVYAEIDAQATDNGVALKEAILAFRAENNG